METVGTNVAYEVKDGKLMIEVDLTKEFGRSASGKTIRIASTEGNMKVGDTPAIMGLNIYRKP